MTIEESMNYWRPIIKSLNIDFNDTEISCITRKKEFYDLKCEFGLKVFIGASKICLISDNCDYVIKFNTNEEEFQDSFTKNEVLREVDIYNRACESNLEMFFPETLYFIKHNEICFILQKKIDYSVSSCSFYVREKIYKQIAKTVSYKIRDKAINAILIKNLPCERMVDEIWISTIISLYGKKKCKQLCDFIQKNKINDLHHSNIGYLNHKPVILDFSGYYDT